MSDVNKIKRANNNKLYVTLGIVVFILLLIGFVAGFDRWIDAKVENHSAIIKLQGGNAQIQKDLEWTQQTVGGEIAEIKEQLKEVNRKLDRLLGE